MAQHTLADRVAALEKRSLKHDKQFEVVGKLIDRGMRMVIELAARQRKFDVQLNKLHADVRELTNSLKRGTNGHVKRKLDIQ